MRRLLLLRHAKAERAAPAGGRDRDRLLAPIGRDDASRLGTYLVRHDFRPDLVVVSTAARTRETWDLAAAAFPAAPPTIYDDRVYDASPETLLGIFHETDKQVGTLLVVGHNPGLHEVATLLIASGDLEARQRINEDFPTAGLAVVDFALDGWSRLHPHAGRLERFISPRSLATATD